jgi:hypothetical protein
MKINNLTRSRKGDIWELSIYRSFRNSHSQVMHGKPARDGKELRRIMFKRIRLLCVILAFGFPSAVVTPQEATDIHGALATILVNPGPFSSVEEAAEGEEKTNWWDGDLSDDRACTECFAAVELSRFLRACTALPKEDISICPPDRLPSKGDVFLIGSTKSNALIASRKVVERRRLERNESFLLKTTRDGNKTITIIEGKDCVGTLYGVYAYLKELGFRFYGLGSKGTVYPEKVTHLPRALDVVENPSFLTRGFWAWEDRGNKEFFLWMARNRMNFWTAAESNVHFLKKLGLKLTDGGHIIQEYFLNPQVEYPYDHEKFELDQGKPKDPYAVGNEYSGDTNGDGKLTYFEAHPEWYGLRGGKRSPHMRNGFGDNYCTSNPDATTELAKNLIQGLIDGRWRHVDIISFWMLDGGKWCQCEDCRKQGSYTDRLLQVVTAVLTEMKNARKEGRLKRNVEISTLAYLETLAPPTRPLPEGFDLDNCSVTFFPIRRCYVHSLADPKCTEINSDILRDYQGWTIGNERYYTGSIFIGEYYNVSSIKSLPVLYPRIMATDIPWYYKTGARHFHYMHTPTHLWGTWTLNQYLLAQLLWNTETDVEGLLDEYFRLYYPSTMLHTKDFYRHLEAAMANIKTWKHNVPGYSLRHRLTSKGKEMFPLKHLHYERYCSESNDGPDIVEMVESMHLAGKHLHASLISCVDQTERARLLEDAQRFEYGKAMVLFYYHLVRTALFHRRSDEVMAGHEFQYVERFAEVLRAIKDLVQVASSHANAQNGLEATQAVNVYEFFKEKYGN